MQAQIYRLRFYVNRLEGNIDSNTIFGCLCFAYKYKYDIVDLELLLNMLESNSEELVISNPLAIKTFELLDRSEEIQIPHSCINRNTGKGGTTFETLITYDTEFDVLIYTTLSEKDIVDLLEIVKINGIGKGRNKGNGAIKSIEIVDKNVKIEHGKTVRSLSNIIPSDNTPTIGNIKYHTRYGKTSENKCQNTVIMISANSEFLSNSEIITGTVLKDSNTGTYINGKSILV